MPPGPVKERSITLAARQALSWGVRSCRVQLAAALAGALPCSAWPAPAGAIWAALPMVAVVVVFSGSVGGAGAAVVVVVAGAAARSVLCVVLVVVTVAAVPLRVLRRCLLCPYAQGSEGSGPSSGSVGGSISSGWSAR